MPKAAGYLRVSTEEQAAHGISLPFQRSRLLAFFQAQGWELYDLYIDDGYSGKDLNRPDMQRLIKDCLRREFEYIGVFKLDRISRRQKDVLYLIEDVFDVHGIGFRSVTESFDTTCPMGRAQIGMMAVFAQLERDTIIERITYAKSEAAKQGRYMGGPLPLGYTLPPGGKIPQIDPLAAETIKWIFDQYVQGHGYEYLAGVLNTNKVPPPGSAKFWHRSTVKQMVANPFFAGYIEHKGTLYQGQHEAILSEDLWNEAQSLRLDRKNYLVEGNPALLVGRIFCGECGARMRVKPIWQNPRNPKKSKRIHYYVCYSQDGATKSMVKDPNCKCGYKRVETIEGKVVEHLMNYSLNVEALRAALNKKLKPIPPGDVQKTIVKAQRERENIQKKIRKLQDAFLIDAITAEDLRTRTIEFRQSLDYLNDRIPMLEDQLNEHDNPAVSIDYLMNRIQDFGKLWAKATFEERQKIIAKMVTQVRVYKNDRVEVSII